MAQQQMDPNQLLQAMQLQVAQQIGEMLQKRVKFLWIFMKFQLIVDVLH